MGVERRLITQMSVSCRGGTLLQYIFPTGIYLAPGDVLEVKFSDDGGHSFHTEHSSENPGDIVLGTEDYRVVEDYKQLSAEVS